MALCSRQSGKSTVCCYTAVWTAIHRPKSLILIVAPAQRQAIEDQKRCYEILERAGIGEKTMKEYNQTQCKLRNGSRIISLPGNETSTRGYSAPDIILVDEANLVPDPIFQSLLPSTATNKKARWLLVSTPLLTSGFFYDNWFSGNSQFERFEVPASECPRISAEHLEQARMTMSPIAYSSEYECIWGLDAASMWSRDLVNSAISDTIHPLFPRVSVGDFLLQGG